MSFGEGVAGWRRPMLAREDLVLRGSPQLEVRVAKRVDITRATQSLTGGKTVCSVLARMVYECQTHDETRRVEGTPSQSPTMHCSTQPPK